jgi:molybdate transport system substrate-binding protein
MVLYAPGLESLPDPAWAVLRRPGVRVAIANPRTAPYGVAARAALAAFGVEAGAEGAALRRGPQDDAAIVITGENVGQALQFARSGAADVGLVALAQVRREPARHYVLVPPEHYPPLWHDAVLLEPGRDHPGARAFLTFLREPVARDILEGMGYQSGDSTTRRP